MLYLFLLSACAQQEQAIVSNDSSPCGEVPVSCGGKRPTPYPTPRADEPSLLQDWIEHAPCDAPCWNGITPGVTTSKQALEILKSLPEVSRLHPSGNSTLERGQYLWSGPWPDTFGSFDYDVDTSIVRSIYPPYAGTVRLEQMIERYGEPDYLYVWAYIELPFEKNPGRKHFSLRVGFLEGTVWMNVIVEDDSVQPTISPSLLLSSPRFYKDFYFKDTNGDQPVTWEGFQSFEWYCYKRYPSSSVCDPAYEMPK
jgi:hypothetical protein